MIPLAAAEEDEDGGRGQPHFLMCEVHSGSNLF